MNCKAALKHSKIASNCQHDGTSKQPKRRRAEKTAIAKKMALHIEPKKRRADRTAIANMMALHVKPKVRRSEKTEVDKGKRGMTNDKIHAKGPVGLKQEQK